MVVCVLPGGSTSEGAAQVKIALDARLTRQMSVGMKAYARELALRLPRVAPDMQFEAFTRGKNFGWDEQVRLPAAIRRARVDLTHFLSLYTPLLPPRPYVVTIHDLIHLRFPEYFKSKVGPYYRTHVRFVCARARRIITDDERTTEDLQRFLGIDPERVRIVPLGVDDEFLREHVPHRTHRPYILYAGNHRPHKDLPTLFEAWASLPPEIAMDLYVTGDDDFGNLRGRFSRQHGRAVALGDVTGAELASLYAGAVALVHPALCEGFGLPMLEAMACGCPVVACDDAVPGVLRDAALRFPARDSRAARDALLRLLADQGLRTALVNDGKERASALTWDACAQRTAEVYREVLEERRS
jgi:glycosyltransferase involved in cell wall biosynthesis